MKKEPSSVRNSVGIFFSWVKKFDALVKMFKKVIARMENHSEGTAYFFYLHEAGVPHDVCTHCHY